MARPIKDTPVLLGKDAAKFNNAIKKESVKKVSEKKREELQRSFNRFTLVAH